MQTNLIYLLIYDRFDLYKFMNRKIEGGITIDEKKQENYLEKTTLIPLLILALIACVLSTLSVQIYQLHYGPYVRTLQCYFNLKILQHDSWDIYQAVQVVYWRTDQYNNWEDINSLFLRIADTIRNLEYQSFIDLNYDKMETHGQSKMQAQYYKKGQDSQIIFFQRPISQLDVLFSETFFQKRFFQYLRNVRLVIVLPIIQYQHHTGIQIEVLIHIDSGLLMGVTVNADPIRIQIQDSQSKAKNTTSDLQIRKMESYVKMELQIVYLAWINVGLNAIIFISEFWRYMLDYKKLQLKNRKSYQSSSSQIFAHKQINSDEKAINSQQTVYNLKIMIKKLGIPRLLGILTSLLAFISYFYGNSQGLLCLFCWLRIVTYLSFTNNQFMIGILFKRAIPIYAKILSNLVIILTAFVLLSMVIYRVTIKFQSLQLSYYQYLFNYFQYGIYQNFMAMAPYNFGGQLLYFIQLFLLVNMGNNILQSVLAGQVLKNSNQRNLQEMLQSFQYTCPNCYSSPKIKKTIQVSLQKKTRFFSKLIEENFMRLKLPQAYQIKILSPKLSPYFPVARQPISPKKIPTRKRQNSESSQYNSKFYDYDDQKVIFQIGDQNQIAPQIQFNLKIKQSRQSIQALLLKIYRVDHNQAIKSISPQQKMQIFIVLRPLARKIENIIKNSCKEQ